MPDESLIHFDAARAGSPATHVLVIAIGHYDHLAGGKGPLSRHAEGMGQLSSPPVSARAVVEWFLSPAFDNPDRPLGSLAVTLSDGASQTIKNAEREFVVPEADARNVVQAIQEWFGRCNTHPENMAVFYFCGHGVASGSRMSLALKDFGRLEANPFAGALDLMSLLTAMETCRSSQQAFFIDACRVASGTMARTDTSLGERPLMPDVTRRYDLEDGAAQQTYYATLPGEAAYARPRRVSIFTEALLWGLGGGGAANEDGEWWTQSLRLMEAIDFFSDRNRRGRPGRLQRPESGRQSAMRLNRVDVDARFATAYVALDKHDAWPLARLSYAANVGSAADSATGLDLSRTGLADWEVRVTPGEYQFKVSWAAELQYTAHSVTAWVVPPYKRITLKVRP